MRDVFVVPGGCTLVRADLFAALGGFDAGIDYLGEDLDLCWRAHVAGARVLVVPSAQVRHLEALGLRRDVDDRRRLQARHRLRTVLACYRPFHLVRVLPQAAVMTVVEGGYALVAGQPRQAADVVGAWTWNLRRIGEIRAKRKSIKPTRSVPDKEVRELQVRGSARLTAFIRGQIGKGDDRLAAMTRSGRQFAGALKARSSRAALVVGAVVLALVVIGSRNLVRTSIPAVGELSQFPSAGVAARRVDLDVAHVRAGRGGARASGARRDRRGRAGCSATPPASCARCSRSSLVPIGILGAWRLARPIGSLRAGIAAFVVYAAVPVPYNALGPRQLGWPRRLRRRAVGRPAAGPGQPARALRARGPRRRLARGLGHAGHAVGAPPDRRPRSRPGAWPRRSCRSSSCSASSPRSPWRSDRSWPVGPAVPDGCSPSGPAPRSPPACCTCRGRGTSSGPTPGGTCSPASARPTAATSPPRRCCASRPGPTAACSATPC